MSTKSGNPETPLAAELNNPVTESTYDPIISYSNYNDPTNKHTLLSDALDVADNKVKSKNSDNTKHEKGEYSISSLPNMSNTGLMD